MEWIPNEGIFQVPAQSCGSYSLVPASVKQLVIEAMPRQVDVIYDLIESINLVPIYISILMCDRRYNRVSLACRNFTWDI